ncbi:gfo/Idh/MocA family oxidoreductase [Paenibacillus agaridevorans]|uniref:Gfo/Idh/MocA family oxidoreductase n=1 Tax=Paenibacillus agaridevorans TaxID=171404 RepID=A0A2R5EWG2_9BACL|nr:Gfo/Idh/MocA family oxidoreductase [Paenibacillus agaridevorans]GBG11042.1 gfo/Idh/MocA family oxidoreductase [Paenibacillus agaridevorans]
MTIIRLGIIGCGSMASDNHSQGLLELAQTMKVTATCDLILEQAQNLAAKLGDVIAVKDFQDLLPHVDAVLIALPHDLHYEVGIACLKAGKHVLMEKPMANTEAQCIELMETAEKANLTLMSAYPVRFWPIIRKMKEIVDAKTYGEVFQMSVWTEQLTIPPEGHWIRSAARLGGGQFFSHGCHYVDLLLWFLGEPIKGAHFGSNLGVPWMEKEGTSNVVIEFADGVMGYHMGTWGARGTRLGYSVHIHLTKGMLEYHRGEGKLYLHTQMSEERANQDTSSVTEILMEEKDSGKQTQFEIQHFLDCILNGDKPFTDAHSTLQGLRVIWKLYEAEEDNTIADLRGLGLAIAASKSIS